MTKWKINQCLHYNIVHHVGKVSTLHTVYPAIPLFAIMFRVYPLNNRGKNQWNWRSAFFRCLPNFYGWLILLNYKLFKFHLNTKVHQASLSLRNILFLILGFYLVRSKCLHSYASKEHWKKLPVEVSFFRRVFLYFKDNFIITKHFFSLLDGINDFCHK